MGVEDATNYLEKPYSFTNLFFGSCIGRYTGRISGRKFEIDGLSYPLKSKNGVHLHNGEGYDKK